MQSKSEQREGDFRKKLKNFYGGSENFCKVLGKGKLWGRCLKRKEKVKIFFDDCSEKGRE
jgi:hypothetical protein